MRRGTHEAAALLFATATATDAADFTLAALATAACAFASAWPNAARASRGSWC